MVRDRVGPVALVGGNEHRDPCQPVDRWLLERTGATRPEVAVIPAASLPGTRAATGALARTYWAGLGARAVVVSWRQLTRSLDAVARADVIVLTGGVPALLVAALGDSPLWDAVLARWQEGAGLSGSSAGAMAMFDWRLRLRPPSTLGLVPGLGPLTGTVVVPHFDRLVAPWPVMRRLVRGGHLRHEGRPVLGIDEGTALVSHEGRAQVIGAGGIDVVGSAGWQRYPAGVEVPPPRLLGPLGLDCVTPVPGPRSQAA